MTDDTILPKTPDLSEIALARDSDDFLLAWANGIREADDPILKGRGGDLKFYDQVRTDGQVWSAMQQRISAIVARKWEVQAGAEDPASEEAAARLKDELDCLDVDLITRRMAWGLFYGYSVGEMMWAAEDGRWKMAGVKVRRARRFGFDIDGNLMLRAVLGKPERRMPDGKFWVTTTGADTDDEPYGLGLAHLCYWPVYFRRSTLKSWMIALDKYASPTAKGSFPPGTPEDDQRKLLAGLRALKQDSAMIHPDGVMVEYLQAAKSGGADFKEFDARIDAWISKVVLSQTMTTDDGSSKSQSDTHMDVRDEVVAADADLICGSFNEGPATWWTEWNFGDRATPPKLVRVMEDEEDLDTASQRDERLFNMGFKPTDERVTETYGEGYEAHTPSPPAPPQITPPELAEDEPDAIGRFVDGLIGSGAAPEAVADLLGPIVDAIDGADSFDDARTALDALQLSDETLAPLRENLAQAAFAARIGGEVGAKLRDDEPGEEV